MWAKGQMVSAARVVLIAGALMTWVRCGSSGQGTGCVEGLRTNCTCATGSQGIRTCQSDSTFGACTCAGVVSTGGAGSGGSGGRAAAGNGAAGNPMGSGGRGSGTGGLRGGTAGAGTAGLNGTGGVGLLGVAAYGACHADSDCRLNATCLRSNAAGTGTGYCSPSCTAGALCLRGNTGEVRATCTNARCVLGSCEKAQCPAGMICVEAVNPSSSGPPMTYTCTYPN